MNEIITVTVAEGKYTFRYEPGKTLACDRYGEAWVDEFNIGSNAIVQLVHLADDQAKHIAELERQVEGCDDCAGMSEEDMQEQLTRSQRENMERIARLEDANAELVSFARGITTSRKGSIGSIDNVYLPQLSVQHIDDLLARHDGAAGDK